METNNSVPPKSMTVEQVIAKIHVMDAQLKELTERNITRMGNLLVTCWRENRPPTIEEIEQIGRELLPKPHLVAQAVHYALKGD